MDSEASIVKCTLYEWKNKFMYDWFIHTWIIFCQRGAHKKSDLLWKALWGVMWNNWNRISCYAFQFDSEEWLSGVALRSSPCLCSCHGLIVALGRQVGEAEAKTMLHTQRDAPSLRATYIGFVVPCLDNLRQHSCNTVYCEVYQLFFCVFNESQGTQNKNIKIQNYGSLKVYAH